MISAADSNSNALEIARAFGKRILTRLHGGGHALSGGESCSGSNVRSSSRPRFTLRMRSTE